MRLSLVRTASAVVVAIAGFAASARADDFLRQQDDLWRASKLIGVPIYGPDRKKVGEIADVLIDRSGKATDVVVGVGGFLGMGEKNVAIPFDKLAFSQEPIASTPTAGAAPDVGLGTPAPADGAGLAPAGSPIAASGTATAPDIAPRPRASSNPDHGTVIYTADQLKAAPAFAFTR